MVEKVPSSCSAAIGDDSGMDAVQRRLMFDDECILVDENDDVVGHDSKYNCHLMEKIEKENLLHRAFSVFLFNSKYELLLQQRSSTKVTFPLVWTNTCCSHPLYRETELIDENALGTLVPCCTRSTPTHVVPVLHPRKVCFFSISPLSNWHVSSLLPLDLQSSLLLCKNK